MGGRVAAGARGRFFYGWVIAATGFCSMFMLRGIESFAFSAFMKPMTEELHWTRAAFSGVQSFSTVVSGFVSFGVGPLIDKRGARGLMIFGAVLAGAGYVASSLTRGIWDFYFIRAVAITIGVACAGSLPVNVAIANWFIRKRGLAVSIGFLGASLGGVFLVPFVAWLITNYNWRTAWVVVGIAVWVVIIPPVAIFMKRRPEDIGLLPDGDAPPADGNAVVAKRRIGKNLSSEVSWTRREAVRTPALWLTIMAFGLGAVGGSAMALHFFSLLTDIGMSETAAATAISLQAIFSSIAKLCWGIIVDRFHVRYCGIVTFFLCALAYAVFAILTKSSPLWLIYFAAAFAGLTTGGMTPVQEVLWANYFGRLSLGAIRSIALPFSLIFSAGGPFAAGWAYDRFGSYQLAFAIFSVLLGVAVVLIYLARPPKKPVSSEVVITS